MPDYTTIAQRIAEAKRRGCKVQKTVSGCVYDLDNLPLYDPDHDADCRSHGVSIVEPERVRCVMYTGDPDYLAYPCGVAGCPLHDASIVEPEVHCKCRKCTPQTTCFIVCEQCGNKRCPHADYHGYECTRSNEPGQTGKLVDTPPLPPAEEKQIGRQVNGDEVQWYNAETKPEPPPLAPCPKCGGKCRIYEKNGPVVYCDDGSCNYGCVLLGGSIVRLADHPVRPDRTAEIVALFRELHERLGKLLEGKS